MSTKIDVENSMLFILVRNLQKATILYTNTICNFKKIVIRGAIFQRIA